MLKSIGSFKFKGAPFSAWIFRIAHNLVVDFHRKASKRKHVQLDEVQIRDEASVEAKVELRLSLQEVQTATRKLTQAQSQVIALRFASGLSLSETAQAMNKREGAIKSLQHSAIAALRRSLNVDQPSLQQANPSEQVSR